MQLDSLKLSWSLVDHPGCNEGNSPWMRDQLRITSTEAPFALSVQYKPSARLQPISVNTARKIITSVVASVKA